MTDRTWHLEEFERISRLLLSSGIVTSVNLYGSVERGKHDRFSDLDLTVIADPLLTPESIIAHFSENDILAQERYWGKESALLRLLLFDGKQYDVKILSNEQDQRDRTWISLPGTDNFWFALHSALHALIRRNDLVALDLILASYRAVTQQYWQVDEAQKELIMDTLKSLNLKMSRNELLSAIRHIADLAGIAFEDNARSQAFIRIMAEHKVALN